METSIGRKVALVRKARGMSQRQLADRLGYSMSWVKKIEGCARPLDRYSVIAEVAKALGVHVSELTEEPVRVRDEHDAHQSVQDIRGRLLASQREEPDRTRAVETLARDIRAAIITRQAGRFAAFGRAVPGLLDEVEHAVATATGAEKEQAVSALVELLHGTAMLLRRLGHVDLAWIALNRAATALPASGDPLLPAVQDWQTAETLFRAGQTDQALHVVDHGLGILAEQRATGPAGSSLYGTFHLLHAIGAAQGEDPSRAMEALTEARATADSVGRGRDDYQTVFGPTEVAIASIAANVEMGRTGTALEWAKDVRPFEVQTVERQARYQIDLARVYAQARNERAAYVAIARAYKAAPEYVRNHVMAREVVAWLIDRERRASMTGLRTLAKHMGIV
ncbi:MAG TPA: helix-turn-helix domain-containing protein [Mycobacteriales bacterium]